MTRPGLLLLATAALGCSGNAVVDRVESGDLVVLDDGTRVRYAGVEAPKPGEALFEESRKRNESLVLHRQLTLVPVAPPGGQEGDGELVAFAYAPVHEGGRERLLSVQAELVLFGWVRARTPAPPRERDELFSDIEAYELIARAEKRGRWAETPAP